jgi:hypothetical protein
MGGPAVAMFFTAYKVYNLANLVFDSLDYLSEAEDTNDQDVNVLFV